MEAAKRALVTHGHGMASVRFICGTQDIHRRLEEKLAAFHGAEVRGGVVGDALNADDPETAVLAPGFYSFLTHPAET